MSKPFGAKAARTMKAAWKNSFRASSNFGNQTVRPSTSNTKHRCPDISGFAASLLARRGHSPNCRSRRIYCRKHHRLLETTGTIRSPFFAKKLATNGQDTRHLRCEPLQLQLTVTLKESRQAPLGRRSRGPENFQRPATPIRSGSDEILSYSIQLPTNRMNSVVRGAILLFSNPQRFSSSQRTDVMPVCTSSSIAAVRRRI